MRMNINGKMETIPCGKVNREYLKKQTIKKLLILIGLKSRSIAGCKNKLVDMLDGINFTHS